MFLKHPKRFIFRGTTFLSISLTEERFLVPLSNFLGGGKSQSTKRTIRIVRKRSKHLGAGGKVVVIRAINVLF